MTVERFRSRDCVVATVCRGRQCMESWNGLSECLTREESDVLDLARASPVVRLPVMLLLSAEAVNVPLYTSLISWASEVELTQQSTCMPPH